MSSLVVRVSKIARVRAHENADALEIVEIGGWQCVVQKGYYAAGERVIYFPPDTVLPQLYTDAFGVTKYCVPARDYHDGSGQRIRCTRLRGAPSFGLVVGVGELETAFNEWGFRLTASRFLEDHDMGDDVSAVFKAQKYEPPVILKTGEALLDHPLFPQYTDIENLRNFPQVFWANEKITVAEKIHGANCRVGVVEGESMAGSHKVRRAPPKNGLLSDNPYWYPWTLGPVLSLMNQLRHTRQAAVLYGEVYGRGIQSLHYGQRGLAFAAFDLWVDGRYLGADDFRLLCDMYGVPVAPQLGEITWCDDGMGLASTYASGPTHVGGEFPGHHLREGVVLRPIVERQDWQIGRVILKYKSDEFLLKEGQR